jgi:membrane fusion protein, multidrug efflux system
MAAHARRCWPGGRGVEFAVYMPQGLEDVPANHVTTRRASDSGAVCAENLRFWRTLLNSRLVRAVCGVVGALPLLSVGSAGLFGCDRLQGASGTAKPARQPAAPVTVAVAIEKDMPLRLQAIGRVQAYTTVTIKPQVGGQLAEAHFANGQDVRSGDLLFTLDARPFQAALQQAQGELAKSIALMEDAELEAQWQESLRERGLGTQRESQNKRALAESLKAAVEADRAAIEKARLDLEYCSISAPMDARAGEILANPGNVVKANETALVTLNQLQPIYVNFSVPEQELGRIKRARAGRELPVQAIIPEDDGPPEVGVLSFMDNTVDSATGMISLKGTFTNASRRLWPGQYVNVALTLGAREAVVVVPTAAVQVSQTGRYVFIVKDDLTAESRDVKTGIAVADETVIEEGLRAGERVVTDGHLRLMQGAKVDIRKPAGAGQPGVTTTQPETRP